MPFYAYECDRCGPFEEFRPMAYFAEPCDCPECGHPAPRQLAAASLAAGSVSAGAPVPAKPGRPHRAGCGCCTPPVRKGLKAEAAVLGAPKRAPKTSSASFLDRA
jgi:putative FmdB family regulatory protein